MAKLTFLEWALIAICVILIAAVALLAHSKHFAVANMKDSAKMKKLDDKQTTLNHYADSLTTVLTHQRDSLAQYVIRIRQERDSFRIVATHQLTTIRYVYKDKIAHVDRLPADSLVSILAGQLRH